MSARMKFVLPFPPENSHLYWFPHSFRVIFPFPFPSRPIPETGQIQRRMFNELRNTNCKLEVSRSGGSRRPASRAKEWQKVLAGLETRDIAHIGDLEKHFEAFWLNTYKIISVHEQLNKLVSTTMTQYLLHDTVGLSSDHSINQIR